MVKEKKNENEAQLEKRIGRLKEEIGALGEMHPGKLSRQFNICGNPTCKCKDKHDPVKHGPYYNLSYTFQKKGRTKFIRQELVGDFTRYTATYKNLRELVDQLIECNIKLIDLRTKRS